MKQSNISKLLVLIVFLFSIIMPFKGNAGAEINSLYVSEIDFNEEAGFVGLQWSTAKTFEMKDDEESLIIYKDGQPYPLESEQVGYMEDPVNAIFARYNSRDYRIEPGEAYTYQMELTIGDNTFTSEEFIVEIPKGAVVAEPSGLADEETVSESETAVEDEAEPETDDGQAPSDPETKDSQQSREDSGLFSDANLEETIIQQLGIYNRTLTEEDLLGLNHLTISNAVGEVSDFSGLEKAVNMDSVEFRYQNNINITQLNSIESISSLEFDHSPLMNPEELLSFDQLERVTYIGESPSYEEFAIYKELLLQGKDVWVNNGEWLDVTPSVKGTEITLDMIHAGNEEITDFEIYLNRNFFEEIPYQKEIQYMFEDLEPHSAYNIIIIAKNEEGVVGITQTGEQTYNAPVEDDIGYGNGSYDEQDTEWRDNPTGDIVEFQEPAIEAEVRNRLDIPNRAIYISDMKHLQTVYVPYAEVSSLADLETAVNLEELNVSSNKISDLSPLAGLEKLHTLDLNDNSVKDLSYLADKQELNYLYINNNPVSSIDSLDGLPLLDLTVRGTDIDSIDVLKSLQSLTSISADRLLYLEDNEANQAVIAALEERGVMVYADPGTAYMDLLDSRVSDTKAEFGFYGSYKGGYHAEADKLILTAGDQTVELAGDEHEYTLQDLKPATEYKVKIEAFKEDELIGNLSFTIDTKDAPTGEEVTFADQELAELVKEELLLDRTIYQSDMENLQSIGIDGPDIKSLDGLEFAINLRSIYIANSDITDLSSISGAKELQSLVLNNVPVEDLSFVQQLTKVNDLWLESVKVKDFSFLSELEQLRYLTIKESSLKDLPDLSQINLEDVDLSGNQLISVNGLRNINDLGILDVSNNKITNIDALSTLNLRFLGINGNPIEKINGTFEKVYSIRIGENPFDPALINAVFPSLEELTIKGDLSNYDRLTNMDSSLRSMTIQDTTMDSIEFLKDLSVSLIRIENTNENLSFKKGTDERRVKEELEAGGTYIEINSYNEVKVTEAVEGEDSLKVGWTYDGFEEADKFRLSLNREIIDEVSGDIRSYTFTDLEPGRNYELIIHVFGKDGYLWETYENYTTLAAGEETKTPPAEDADQDTQEEPTDTSGPDENGNDATDNPVEEPDKEDTVKGKPTNGTVPEKTTVKKVKAVKKAGKYVVDSAALENIEEKATVSIEVAKEGAASIQMSREQIQTLQKQGASVQVDNTDVKVKIPAINLPEGKTAEITVKAMKAEGALAAYDFTISADGKTYHQFDEEMTLEFSVDVSKVKNPENLRVFYYNEDTSEWEMIAGRFVDGKVIAQTDHFSTYAVFEVSGKELASGDLAKTPEKPSENRDTNTLVEPAPNGHKEKTKNPNRELSGEAAGAKLPVTGTEHYKLLLLGTLLTAISITLAAFRRKQSL
ncbi:hypothetical protein D3H55_06300 [Bacillus salacetis]|uniref:LPXTG cell wall anchor domain-containing protein n=1 Tax=Bacillus salacetis TaxID=2315464 RepID=A0A3A1R2W6_9BACI|nr:leucine-rich repeat domain-containing protein [Bacillus salacetis]RIW36066.1 hypothetical protein D3H55_06300 [Bacillus salacetis]